MLNRLSLIGWFLIMGFFLLCPQATESASRQSVMVTVNFKNQASVNKDFIYLEDIATIKGSPRVWVDRIAQLKIKESPFPGEALILLREEIARKIKPINLPSLVARLQIPEQIEVVREGRAVELPEIVRMLEGHFQKMAGNRNRTVKVMDVRGYERVIVSPGILSFELRGAEQVPRSGDISATMVLLVDGLEIKRMRIHARLEIYAEVVSARHYLNRHQELEVKDVQIVSKNIALLPSDVVTDVGDVLGKRTTLTVNAQEVLRKGMIETPPLVKKGDRVLLLFENERMKITALGEVKENGKRGDRVRLINVSSKKEVSGRVLDASTVQVDF